MDCPSCGAHEQTRAHCDACGFALPVVDGGHDGALAMFLGLVCPSCDSYNDAATRACVECGAALDDDVVVGTHIEPAHVDEAATASPQHAPPVAAGSRAATMGALPMPDWMTPPPGKPLATSNAIPRVDLAVLAHGGTPLAAPSPAPPRTPTPLVAPASTTPRAPTPRIAMSTPPVPKHDARTSTAGAVPAPISTPPMPAVACWRCQATHEPGDRFCRNCGARVGEAPPPSPALGTLAGVKVPTAATVAPLATAGSPAPAQSASAAPQAASSATMVMPAFRAAQAAPAPAAAPAHAAAATLVFGAVQVERSARLILVRGNNQFGSQWSLHGGETIVGRSVGMVLFPNDTALAARHARLVFQGNDLWVVPEDTRNGVFVRLRGPEAIGAGDEFIVGAQRLRVLTSHEQPAGILPTHDGTALLGSLVKAHPPIVIARLSPDERHNEIYYRPQRMLTFGRASCDVCYPTDSFVSERHAQLTHDGDHLILEDLKSRNGTYLRARGAMQLHHGDLLLLGDEVLRVELSQRA